ncbi:MAG: methionine--tRNA ligase [Patescibacteria group bacterium]
MTRRYLTTAIDFPNAAPHLGHAYEKVLADCIVRWFRLQGDTVRFHIGTDENGIKIQQTAKAAGITPRELIDRNAPLFQNLFRKLHISHDYFIRTADPVSHWPTVTALWKKLKEAGALEKRKYTGLYCNGCERFVTEKDLLDGKCPEHNEIPEEVTEENWFYLLQKRENDLKKLLDPKKGTYRIVPSFRGNETRSFLEQGLEDVSFSRSKQTLTWGVPVPDDSEQVMYVWCDNLTSYISSLGLLTEHAMPEWWDDAEVTHIIGKDIARFHALNWPAMLLDAGVRAPDRLLVHGFITHEGRKMSKTLGNVVDPHDIISRYGVDAFRFFFIHEIPMGNDGDFSWKRFHEIYDSKLRNQVGNLLNRVLTLLQKDGGTLAVPSKDILRLQVEWNTYARAMEVFELSGAIGVASALAARGDKFIDEKKPWQRDAKDRRETLSTLAELLRHISLLLLPFIPETAQKMSMQLGVPYAGKVLEKNFVITESLKKWGGVSEWKSIGTPAILFPPIEP